MAEGFNFSLSGDVFLKNEDIWPDGDAPENPTAEDVVRVILSEYSSFREWMSDWDMWPEVWVDGFGGTRHSSIQLYNGSRWVKLDD